MIRQDTLRYAYKNDTINDTIVYSQSLKFNLKLQRTVILIIKYKLQIILN